MGDGTAVEGATEEEEAVGEAAQAEDEEVDKETESPAKKARIEKDAQEEPADDGAIRAGCVFVCELPADVERQTDIYESATLEEVIGVLKEGEQVTAAGTPWEEEGYEIMLPINWKSSTGAVELRFLRRIPAGTAAGSFV